MAFVQPRRIYEVFGIGRGGCLFLGTDFTGRVHVKWCMCSDLCSAMYCKEDMLGDSGGRGRREPTQH